MTVNLNNVVEHNILTARRMRANKIIEVAKRYICVSLYKNRLTVEVSIETFHEDRTIDPMQFKEWCQSLLDALETDVEHYEILADNLYTQISMGYLNRDVIINVSSNNEYGCSIKYPKF